MAEYRITKAAVDLIRELAQWWPRIKDVVHRVERMHGAGAARVTNLPSGITIAVPAQSQRQRSQSSSDSQPVRMKIKTAADANGVAICNTWDGTNLGSTDIPVRTVRTTAANDELWAERTSPNAGVTYSGSDVVWLEILHNLPSSTIPVPTAQYQVLQVSSYTNSTTYTLIFDYPRAH
jgi:hypothetical protein